MADACVVGDVCDGVVDWGDVIVLDLVRGEVEEFEPLRLRPLHDGDVHDEGAAHGGVELAGHGKSGELHCGILVHLVRGRKGGASVGVHTKQQFSLLHVFRVHRFQQAIATVQVQEVAATKQSTHDFMPRYFMFTVESHQLPINLPAGISRGRGNPNLCFARLTIYVVHGLIYERLNLI